MINLPMIQYWHYSGLPFALYIDRKDNASGSGAALCTKANP